MSRFARGSFADYVSRICLGVPFAFSRWGDGEWSALLGRSGTNCDGHRYSKALRRDLTAVLESRPSYDLGLQSLAMRRFGAEIKEWLHRRRLAPEWVDADVFAKRSRAGTLAPLLSALAARVVVLVGPPHLAALTHFTIAAHVQTPLRNCHDDVDRVTAEAQVAVGRLTQPVVAVSAGMSANVIVDRLYTAGAGQVTAIDFGSLWEPYVGLAIRTYHRRVLARERETPTRGQGQP